MRWRPGMQMIWGATLALLMIVPSRAAEEARFPLPTSGAVQVIVSSRAAVEARCTLPEAGIVKVAFGVSDNATLIDIGGPMQVFDQVQSPGTTEFQSFTVSETRRPIKAGTMTIVPDYTFA